MLLELIEEKCETFEYIGSCKLLDEAEALNKKYDWFYHLGGVDMVQSEELSREHQTVKP